MIRQNCMQLCTLIVGCIKKFGADEDITETRRESRAVIESGDMIIVSDDNFTNYPAAFIKD